jgi:purine-binding chemotaxis protein CheW
MNKLNQYVVFNLDRWRYGLHLSAVARVVRVVEVTPWPKAPESVLGVVNVHGEVLPVFNLRHRLRLPAREIELSDKLIIAQTANQKSALLVNAVSGVIEPSEEDIVTPEAIMPGVKYSAGMVKVEDGLILLLHDLDKFMSLAAEKMPD